MRKTIILMMSMFALSFICNAQKDENVIKWSESRKLEWNDFKGKPDNNSSDKACTYGTLSYDYEQLSNNEFKFNLFVNFDSDKSWVKTEGKTDKILIHEQYHFDVYELFARIMMKRINDTKALTGEDFSNKVNVVFKEVFNELNAFQDKYDIETNHSIIQDKQIIWQKKIDDMLNEYKDYYKMEITFKIELK